MFEFAASRERQSNYKNYQQINNERLIKSDIMLNIFYNKILTYKTIYLFSPKILYK